MAGKRKRPRRRKPAPPRDERRDDAAPEEFDATLTEDELGALAGETRADETTLRPPQAPPQGPPREPPPVAGGADPFDEDDRPTDTELWFEPAAEGDDDAGARDGGGPIEIIVEPGAPVRATPSGETPDPEAGGTPSEPARGAHVGDEPWDEDPPTFETATDFELADPAAGAPARAEHDDDAQPHPDPASRGARDVDMEADVAASASRSTPADSREQTATEFGLGPLTPDDGADPFEQTRTEAGTVELASPRAERQDDAQPHPDPASRGARDVDMEADVAASVSRSTPGDPAGDATATELGFELPSPVGPEGEERVDDARPHPDPAHGDPRDGDMEEDVAASASRSSPAEPDPFDATGTMAHHTDPFDGTGTVSPGTDAFDHTMTDVWSEDRFGAEPFHALPVEAPSTRTRAPSTPDTDTAEPVSAPTSRAEPAREEQDQDRRHTDPANQHPPVADHTVAAPRAATGSSPAEHGAADHTLTDVWPKGVPPRQPAMDADPRRASPDDETADPADLAGTGTDTAEPLGGGVTATQEPGGVQGSDPLDMTRTDLGASDVPLPAPRQPFDTFDLTHTAMGEVPFAVIPISDTGVDEEDAGPKPVVLPVRLGVRARLRHSARVTLAQRARASWNVLRDEGRLGDGALLAVLLSIVAAMRSILTLRGLRGVLATPLRLGHLLPWPLWTRDGDHAIHAHWNEQRPRLPNLRAFPWKLWWRRLLELKTPTRAQTAAFARKMGAEVREAIRMRAEIKADRNRKWWRRTLVEIGALFAIVVPIEMVLGDGAVGSFGFHPHPYWLIVLPMAAARGVVAGLVAALVSSILYAIGAAQALTSEETIWTYSNMLEPILFFGVGYFLGELHDELALRYRKLEQRLADVLDRVKRMRQERDVLADANKLLERRIVDDSVQFGNLIVAAARIENADRTEVFEIALDLVEEHCGAAASVLLRLDDGSIDYLCHRGWSGEELGERLEAARRSEFVRRAIQEGVSVNGFRPETTAPESGPLVVAPLFDASGVVRALLCLDEIPASRLNESTITIFFGIAEWISTALARLARGGDAPDPQQALALTSAEFEASLGTSAELGERLRIELERCARYGVPTSLLTIQAVEWTDITREGIDNLDRFVLTHFTGGLRPSDGLYRFGYPGCYLLVLAGTALEGAEVVRTRLLRRLDYTPSRSVGEIRIAATGPDADAPDLVTLIERVARDMRRESSLPLDGKCPVQVPKGAEPGELMAFVGRLKMETSLAVRNGFDLHVVAIEAEAGAELEAGMLARHVHAVGRGLLRPTDAVFAVGTRNVAVILPCAGPEDAATIAHRLVTGLRERDPNAPYGHLETRVMGLGPSHPDAGSFLRAFSQVPADRGVRAP